MRLRLLVNFIKHVFVIVCRYGNRVDGMIETAQGCGSIGLMGIKGRIYHEWF
jgi:hypothetical protein